MKNLMFFLTFLFAVTANAALAPADKAELGITTNYIPNGGGERGVSGFSKYFDGQTFTVTIASPGVVTTSSAHNLVVGDKLYLTSTGSLPTGLSTATLYYVSVVGSSTTFQLTATQGGASINTTGSQSGAHTYRPYSVHGASGGTASHLTLGSTATSPLSGNRSWTIVNSGSTSAMGEGVVYPFIIDTTDKGKALEIVMDYQVTSGTFQPGSLINGVLTDSDLEVYIWDQTNGVPIVPSRIFLDCGTSTSVQCSFSASFTASSTSTSYRLALHVGTTNTTAWSIKGDSLKVRRYVTGFGANGSDWIPFTMSVGAVTTPPTYASSNSVSSFWRRVGDSMQIRYTYFAASATGAAAGSGLYLYSLPSGYSIDTTKVAAGTQAVGAGQHPVGSGTIGQTTTAGGGGSSLSVFAYDSTRLFLISTNQTAGQLNQVSSTNFNYSTANASFEFFAEVPILTWSASQTAVRADQSNFGWTDGGTIGLTSTGGGVVKGATSRDKIVYRRNGQNIDVHFEYKQSGTGTVGTGDYLFLIPGGCIADTTLFSTFTTVSDMRGWMALPNSTVFYGNASNVGVGTAALYDSTHVRIGGTTNSGASVLPIGNGFYSTTDGSIFYGANYSVSCTQFTENQSAPLLVNGVISSTGGQMRVESASIGSTTSCSGSPCTMISNTPAITSITRTGSGAYSVNFASGTWSVAPVCTVMNKSVAALKAATDFTSTTSAFSFVVYQGVSPADDAFSVMCMGNR